MCVTKHSVLFFKIDFITHQTTVKLLKGRLSILQITVGRHPCRPRFFLQVYLIIP